MPQRPPSDCSRPASERAELTGAPVRGRSRSQIRCANRLRSPRRSGSRITFPWRSITTTVGLVRTSKRRLVSSSWTLRGRHHGRAKSFETFSASGAVPEFERDHFSGELFAGPGICRPDPWLRTPARHGGEFRLPGNCRDNCTRSAEGAFLTKLIMRSMRPRSAFQTSREASRNSMTDVFVAGVVEILRERHIRFEQGVFNGSRACVIDAIKRVLASLRSPFAAATRPRTVCAEL